ncbi:cupin domain-containing protein [Enterovirga rhinocerotis]|uniref:Cupin domain n=1 Tax=Enterovirga rhinocerotis TaxID=1339210 RepID=A0A4R7C4P7_9HYPH|nr:cupin domain-containing protein [Enterovirga rhinocerotis]TDR93358.1 cupin domain [Enterovirga rhinocerotis]
MSGPVKAYNWSDVPAREVRPGVTQRGFRGDQCLVTYNTLAPGMEPKPHSHPFDQVFMLISGRVTLHVGEQVIECGPGTVVQIPRDVVHWADAPSPEDGIAVNIDVFAPMREDYGYMVAYQER